MKGSRKYHLIRTLVYLFFGDCGGGGDSCGLVDLILCIPYSFFFSFFFSSGVFGH